MSSATGNPPNPANGNLAKVTRTERLVAWLNPLMAAFIGVVVLILFSVAIARSLGAIGTPPVAANTETGQDGYSAFDRAVQIVGLVSPVLTIVLGFYFGARVGAADAEASKVASREAQNEAESLRLAAAEKDKALSHLQAGAQAGGSAQTVLAEAKQQYPRAFSP